MGPTDAPVRVEATAQGGRFVLSVANAGEPIPPATMERLFQPFYRGEGRSYSQGLGLGLYIASQIAQAHRGALSVSSDEHETKFIFKMPAGPRMSHGGSVLLVAVGRGHQTRAVITQDTGPRCFGPEAPFPFPRVELN